MCLSLLAPASPEPGSAPTLSAARAARQATRKGGEAAGEASRNLPFTGTKNVRRSGDGWRAFGPDADSYCWPRDWNEAGRRSVAVLQQLRRLIAVSSLHLLMRRCHSNPGYLQVDRRVHPWITKQHRWRAALQLAGGGCECVCLSRWHGDAGRYHRFKIKAKKTRNVIELGSKKGRWRGSKMRG